MKKRCQREICDRKVPTEFKGEFYHAVILSTILCGSECLNLNGQNHKKVEVKKT